MIDNNEGTHIMTIETQITDAIAVNYESAPFIARALREQEAGADNYRLTGQVTRTGKPVFIKL